jgi:hypothetical protein
MTATGTHPPNSRIESRRPARRTAGAITRLVWLYLNSRRVPAALGLLAGLGALLAGAMYWRWNIAGGPAAENLIPLTIESAAAAIIAVTTYGPFGEPERATGRRLPYLRLASAVLLTAAAVAALAAGATAGHLPGGGVALVRNVAGISGTGLLAATGLGGAFGWAGPMAYLLVAESALAAGWTTPWIWIAHSSHDTGAALSAACVFIVGAVATTIRGERNRVPA